MPSTQTPKSASRRLVDADPRIGNRLVREGLITSGQLAEALAAQKSTGRKVVETLIALGHLTDAQFVRFLAQQPGIPSISLENCVVTDELVALIPVECARKHELFPIDKMGKLLTVGMVCPLDKAAIADIEARTGLRVKPMLCSMADVRRAMDKYYPLKAKPRN
ncbi:MAG: hypothetical protein AAB353_02355 [Candidatus Hydrogenedentota bacterium]